MDTDCPMANGCAFSIIHKKQLVNNILEIKMKSIKIGLAMLMALACTHIQAYDSTKKIMTAMGVTMPYRECIVASEGNESKPSLVIYLHGGSSKGNDNMKQVLEPGTDSIANYLAAHEQNAIFLIPQCPSDKSWGGVMNAVLKSMIERYVNAGMADPDRVYIFGGSMGGTGTWGMLSAYPDLFAAAMPVAANPSKCVAENVAHTPAYTVMGTADVIMSVQTAENFVGQLKALGDDVAMDTEEGWTHEVTCIESYTTGRLDWVFGHVRGTSTGVGNLSGGETDVIERCYYSIDGNKVEETRPAQVYIMKETLANGKIRCRKVNVQ